jgi:hypothetical protein
MGSEMNKNSSSEKSGSGRLSRDSEDVSRSFRSHLTIGSEEPAMKMRKLADGSAFPMAMAMPMAMPSFPNNFSMAAGLRRCWDAELLGCLAAGMAGRWAGGLVDGVGRGGVGGLVDWLMGWEGEGRGGSEAVGS